MSATRNLGIRHAKGELIAFLDADDVWLPEKLAEQVTLLERHPDVQMVYGAPLYWSGWTGAPEDAARDHVSDVGLPPGTIAEPLDLAWALVAETAGGACPSDLMIRRDALASVGGCEESFVGFRQLYEDQALLAKVYLKHRTLVSHACWTRYRVHDESFGAVSARLGREAHARRFFLEWLHRHLAENGAPEVPLTARLAQRIADELARPAGRAGGLDRADDATRAGAWWLHTSDGNRAALRAEPDGGGVHVVVERAERDPPHGVQLNLSRLSVRGGVRYLLRLDARSDRLRTARVGVSESYPPWSNLGAYLPVELGPEWRSLDTGFTCASDAENARIHLDIGDETGRVEVRGVRLVEAATGREVSPSLPPPYLPPG
jgi:hypothetical protein